VTRDIVFPLQQPYCTHHASAGLNLLCAGNACRTV